MKTLTLAYWCRDEAEYIPEWIEFHILQGADHFIIYDNKSTDNTKEICKPYTDAGLLEIREYPEHVKNRNNFYMMDHMCKEQEGKTKWLHFHAIDERIFCPDGKKLTHWLPDYISKGGVAVGWKLFNSNKQSKKEPGLIIERFTSESAEPNHHIKTIVRPGIATTHAGCPHIFRYKAGYGAVDEHMNPVTRPWHKPSYPMGKFSNHHYVTMSEEEFNTKANKGLLDHAGAENKRRVNAESQWKALEGSVTGVNTDLVSYVGPVKDALRERYKGYPELLTLVTNWYKL